MNDFLGRALRDNYPPRALFAAGSLKGSQPAIYSGVHIQRFTFLVVYGSQGKDYH